MGQKAKHDVAPIIRAAFIRGLGIYCRERGKTTSEVMAEWIAEDWKAVLNAVGKYTVRENTVSGQINHDHKHTHGTVSESAEWIERTLGTGADDTPEKPVSH